MPLRVQRDQVPSIDLTPMIDMVFLLIIFFMVGTHFGDVSDRERKIGLSVPEVANAGTLTAAPRKREVNVFRNGQLTLDDEPVTVRQLQERLADAKRQYPGLGVIVRGDAAAIYQHVADVLAACRGAGVADLGISVRVAQAE